MNKHHYHHYHKSHLSHEQRKSVIETYLIIFFICFIIAIAVATFVKWGPSLNEQLATQKKEIRAQRFGVRDLQEKPAEDFMKYRDRLKRHNK